MKKYYHESYNINDILPFPRAGRVLTASSTTINGQIYTASASSVYGSGFEAWRAFDGIDSINNTWAGVQDSSVWWLQIEFPDIVVPKSIGSRPQNTDNIRWSPRTFDVIGRRSNHDEWKTLASYTNFTGWSLSAITYLPLFLCTPCKQVRIVVYTTNSEHNPPQPSTTLCVMRECIIQ